MFESAFDAVEIEAGDVFFDSALHGVVEENSGAVIFFVFLDDTGGEIDDFVFVEGDEAAGDDGVVVTLFYDIKLGFFAEGVEDFFEVVEFSAHDAVFLVAVV